MRYQADYALRWYNATDVHGGVPKDSRSYATVQVEFMVDGSLDDQTPQPSPLLILLLLRVRSEVKDGFRLRLGPGARPLVVLDRGRRVFEQRFSGLSPWLRSVWPEKEVEWDAHLACADRRAPSLARRAVLLRLRFVRPFLVRPREALSTMKQIIVSYSGTRR